MPNQVVFRRPFRKRGQNWFPTSRPLLRGSVTGSGGVVVGGAATVKFGHATQVDTDVAIEWDFDNDGDFSAGVEDITSYVLSVETFTGRDWPSLLTGKAGPGRFRATLRNDDDRFNYFNTSSPLATAPFSLKTGRKLRLRTSTATNPDPVLLAKDRFRRDNGALGSEEGGLAYTEPLANDFTILANRAVATSEGNEHIAVVDTGSADYYVQVQIAVTGNTDNRVGIVYRYVDSDDYSLCVVDVANASLYLIDVVSGSEAIIAGQSFDVYSNVTIGILVEDTTVTVYREGVAFASATAINTTAELAGIYAEWVTGDTKPEVDNLYVWDGLPTETTGILWTGDVSELVSEVQAGPRKLATISGEGWLSKLATQDVQPPISINGQKTGYLVGNVLANTSLLHPPGSISEGDVTSGTVVIGQTTGINAARMFEETEYGFLHEMQEGPLGFDKRSARDASTSLVTFSDATDAQFGYHGIQPYDWRKEVFNRIVAGISPWTVGAENTLFTDGGPYILSSGGMQTIQATYTSGSAIWTGHSRKVVVTSAPSNPSFSSQTSVGQSTTFGATMPATVNEGDLLIILTATLTSVPTGFTQIGNVFRVFAKVADGTEDGTSVTLTSSNLVDWAVQVIHITSWFGALSGVEISDFVSTTNNPDPPSLSPTWGAEPTTYIAIASAGVATSDPSQSGVPSGYTSGAYTEAGTSPYRACSTAYKQVTDTTSEDPGAFSTSSFSSISAATLAVRGVLVSPTVVTEDLPSGSSGTFTISYVDSVGGTSQTHYDIEVTGTPLTQSDPVLVQSDDYDSQDDHNAIRTYQNSANLFRSVTDAQTYADLVLDTHADDRPILSISFFATKSPAYRKQAYTRRVGDRITLVANNNSGLGISQDFYIESISHRISQGNTLWEVTWELSPV